VSGVVGGLVAALLWGSSTVVASRSTRMIGSQQALAYVMLSGLVMTALIAPLVDGRPTGGSGGAAWALAAGAASVGGLSMLYRALQIGKVGVVAPISSTEGALGAVFSVILLGEQLSPGLVVALTVAAAGVAVVTFQGSVGDLELRPSLYALSAAAIFGFGLVASSQAGDSVGAFWAILAARAVGVVTVALPLALRGRLPLPGAALWLVIFSGFAEVAGFAGFIIGSRHGVAVPAVLASQFAAVAVLISYLVYGERLTRVQLAGAAAIAAAVAAVAAMRA
jgi:drug/metabolite transporter (DMT)-like permease